MLEVISSFMNIFGRMPVFGPKSTLWGPFACIFKSPLEYHDVKVSRRFVQEVFMRYRRYKQQTIKQKPFEVNLPMHIWKFPNGEEIGSRNLVMAYGLFPHPISVVTELLYYDELSFEVRVQIRFDLACSSQPIKMEIRFKSWIRIETIPYKPTICCAFTSYPYWS